MRRKFYLEACSAFLFFITLSEVFLAQAQYEIVRGDKASVLVPNTDLVVFQGSAEIPVFITLSKPLNEDPSSWLKKLVGDHPGISFGLQKVSGPDELGITHYSFQEFYGSVEIENAVYRVHCSSEGIVSAGGGYYIPGNISVQPTLSRREAMVSAKSYFPVRYFRNDEYYTVNKAEEESRLIVKIIDGKAHLCYAIDFYAMVPLMRMKVYIDAHDGSLVKHTNMLCTSDVPGTAHTMYTGVKTITTDSSDGVFRLQESGRSISTKNLEQGILAAMASDFVDDDNNWTSTDNNDHAALDVHYALESVYDFYLDSLGRDSYDDEGGEINAYIHFSQNFSNAFWDGSSMYFGDGNGTTVLPLTAFDVTAHEFVHGVTQYTGALEYQGESGAINESFSDMFAVSIEHAKNPETANFLIGEQITTFGALRNMGNPNQTGTPDTYQGYFWISDPQVDNGGVHYNSQVMNHWFYLLCNGGNGLNDFGNYYNVEAINMYDVVDVLYRAIRFYMDSEETFAMARLHTIESAEDIFGPCSQQAMQIANAWYAVGVGQPFDESAFADFNTSSSIYCSVPAEVHFQNHSLGATSFEWSFDDESSSVEENPVHTYTEAGSYSIQLIANGTGVCSVTDTLYLQDIINVIDADGPVESYCYPTTTSPLDNRGIRYVKLESIDKYSGPASSGEHDFSCLESADVVAGGNYVLRIGTFGSLETVKAWIDYNGDGNFNPLTELIFTHADDSVHQDIIHIPEDAMPGNFRMRVISDSQDIEGACDSPEHGEYEDYSVVIEEASQAPMADFIASQTSINIGSGTWFTDLCTTSLDSWQWEFEGGFPSESSEENPWVTYSTPGIYAVTLTVSNSWGTDTEVKTGYIEVTSEYLISCSGDGFSNASEGSLYDSGGPLNDYVNCYGSRGFLIDPPCEGEIEIVIPYLDLYALNSFTQHRLHIYDGVDEFGDELFDENELASPITIIAHSGAAYILFESQSYAADIGFELTWTFVPDESALIVAGFMPSAGPVPINATVQFQDTSTGNPNSWYWDFGDGEYSISMNPVHAFASAGSYLVTLVASNCSDSDTLSQWIEVDIEPVVSITPQSFDFELPCNSTVTADIIIENEGPGLLQWETETNEEGDVPGTTDILLLTKRADITPRLDNLISAIQGTDVNYNLVLSEATTPYFPEVLEGMDVVIKPFHDIYPLPMTPLFDVGADLLEFAEQGGTVIITAQFNGANMNALEVFDTNDPVYTFGQLFQVEDPAHYITQGLPATFTSTDQLMPLTFEDDGIISLVTLEENPDYNMVAYRNHGEGKLFYIGYHFYEQDFYSSVLLQRILEFSASAQEEIFIQDDVEGVLAAGESDTLSITFDMTGMPSGAYHYSIPVTTNDTDANAEVMVNIVVLPSVSIMTDASCISFDPVVQTLSGLDSLLVFNTGQCDTLLLDSIEIDNGIFVMESFPSFILPGDSAYLFVSFHPVAPESYSGNMVIYTNAGELEICLDGDGLGTPEWSSVPESIELDLTCGESNSIEVEITNSGNGNLEWFLDGNEGIGLADEVTAMVLTYGTSNSIVNNIINGVNQFFDGCDFISSNSNDPAVIEPLLNGVDVIVLPNRNGFENFLLAFAPLLQDFAMNGGTVILCSAIQVNYLDASGLFTAVEFDGLADQVTVNVVEPDNMLATGLPTSFQSGFSVSAHDILDENKVEVISYQGHDVVTYRRLGQGYAVFVGYTFSTANTNMSQVMANAVRLVDNDPTWLVVGNDTGTIEPSSTGIATFTVDASSLELGPHAYTIEFYSNDLDEHIIEIPVVLNVTGSPEVTIQEPCIYFEEMVIDGSTTDSLVVYNTGCDTLFVESPITTSSGFTVISFESFILPGDSGNVVVSFEPLEAVSYDGEMTLTSNDGELLICLQGNGSLAPSPEVVIDPLEIEIDLDCELWTSFIIEIQNTGDAGLEWALDDPADDGVEWILVEELSGNVSAGTSGILYVQIDTGIFEDATYEYSLVLNTSDTDEAIIIIPVIINTSAEPEIVVTDDCLEMGSTMVGNTVWMEMPVYNAGCDTLELIGIDENEPMFSVVSFPAFLSPGETGNISVEFLPASTGFYNAVFTILSNVGSTEFCASGSGVEPIMVLSHDSLHMEATVCEESIAQSFTISNSGSAALEGELTELGSWPVGFSLDILTFEVLPGSGQIITLTGSPQTINPGEYSFAVGVSTNETISGVDTVFISLVIDEAICGPLAVADFEFLYDDCDALVDFVNTSINATSWNWNFGDEQTSTVQNPSHTYSDPGEYEVTLISSNEWGSADTTSIVVEVNFVGVGLIISSQVTGLLYDFSLTSFTGEEVTWDFGTGGTAEGENVTHTFPGLGTYTITATVSTGNCSVEVETTITISTDGIVESKGNEQFLLYPNPSTGQSILEIDLIKASVITIELFDVNGRLVNVICTHKNLPAGSHRFAIETKEPGIYSIRIRNADQQRMLKWIRL